MMRGLYQLTLVALQLALLLELAPPLAEALRRGATFGAFAGSGLGVVQLAASLAAKKPTPFTAGTLRTDTLTFGFLLLGTVLLVGALLFLPAAVLGPVAGR